jgi:hypothetical protein
MNGLLQEVGSSEDAPLRPGAIRSTSGAEARSPRHFVLRAALCTRTSSWSAFAAEEMR